MTVPQVQDLWEQTAKSERQTTNQCNPGIKYKRQKYSYQGLGLLQSSWRTIIIIIIIGFSNDI